MISSPRGDAPQPRPSFRPAGAAPVRYCLLATIAGIVLPAAATLAVVGWARTGRLGTAGWHTDVLGGVLAVLAALAVVALAQAAWRHWSLPGPGLAEYLPHRWLQRKEAVRRSNELLAGLSALPTGPSPESAELLVELADALAATNPYQRGRPQRRARLSAELARELDLPGHESGQLQLAAQLQDIGLAEVPPEILDQPGALEEGEGDLVRRHPATTAALIAPWVEPEVVAAVLSHHEHGDGGGYPQGLAGQEIPALAVLLAVVDSYDALISDRPQRRGYSPAEAATELQSMAGTWLAETPVAALLSAVRGHPEETGPWAGMSPAVSQLRHAVRGTAAPLTAGVALLLVALAAWSGDLSALPTTVSAVSPPQASPATSPSPAQTHPASATPASPASSPAPAAAAGPPPAAGQTPPSSGPKAAPAKSPAPAKTSPAPKTQPTSSGPTVIQVPGSINTSPSPGSSSNPAGPPVPAPSPSMGSLLPIVLTTSPLTGPAAGGTTVTIDGSGFTGATAVTFGSAPASFEVNSDSVITAVSPPGQGVVLIKVATPIGTSVSLLAFFTYTGGGSLL